MMRTNQEDALPIISLLFRREVRPHVLGLVALALTDCIIKCWPNISAIDGFAHFLSGIGNSLFLVVGYLALLLTELKAGKSRNAKMTLAIFAATTVAVHTVKTLSWSSLSRPSGNPGGYPSGHAAATFALAFLLSCRYQRLTKIWYAIAASISWSRIAVGAHFPFQVYVGSALGLFAAILIYDGFAPNKLLQELVRRAQIVLFAVVPMAAILSSLHEYENDLVLFGFGGVCFVAGVLIRVWSQTAHTKGERFCSSGPYALIRHPTLVANALICIGITVASEIIWLSPLAIILCMIAMRMAAQEDERIHLALFGNLYKDYMSKVPRWFPRLRELWNVKIASWAVVPALKREMLTVLLIMLPLIKEALSHAK